MKYPKYSHLAALALLVTFVYQTQAAAPTADPVKAFCIDFNWGEGGTNGFAKPGLWADASPKEHVAWYAGLGCNVIQTFAVSCNGYAWYKGGIVPPQPGLTHDFLTETVKLGHSRGMKVMGYFCVGANTRWGQTHAELSYGMPSAPHIPFTTDYLDYLCASIEDALQRTGMDGFMIDWVWNPGDLDGTGLRWLDCEQRMYRELFDDDFPGKGKITKEREMEFRRRAIDRCWKHIHDTAKRVKPDCVIWLSCCDMNSPVVVNSKLFKEVDWLMNEATDPAVLAKIDAMKGPHTRLIQCVVGWGDSHDARRILMNSDNRDFGIYGFAKPGTNSLPLPVEEYRHRSIASFQGNDRNIAVLARYFTEASLEIVVSQDPDGRIMLLPGTAAIKGASPIVMDGQVGHWGNPRDTVNWLAKVQKPGQFDVHIEYACEKGMGGSTFLIKVGDGEFAMQSKETGSWRNYQSVTAGRVELKATDRLNVALIPEEKTPWKAISLKSIALIPSADKREGSSLPGIRGVGN